ncbi:MAG TPA: amidase [Blastocatellia bacterium]|nr:amidase [Blastocatellia bacterium]
MKREQTTNRQLRGRQNRPISRRNFVRLLSATGVASFSPRLSVASATQSLLLSDSQQQGPPQVPQRVSKEMLQAAQRLIGIELTDAQITMALPRVNQNLANYETLRQISIPLDTEPAIEFHPTRPPTHRRHVPRQRTPVRLRPVSTPAFKKLDDLAFASIAELAQLIRTRRVSSVDLTTMYLERLKKYGPQLHCVVTLTEDLALDQARDADREIRRGRYRGPLHGIPWGAKDLFATKGIRTTWGAEPYRDQVIDYDATVVERLREAGAILVAKLSLGALAQGPRWFGGVTRTPWNIQENSSGSSAGSAAATAAGLVGFSLGTETLGSIISPSSRCGVVGLRPTYGRVSRYGAMILSPTMDKVGPICRYVEDCALVLEAIYGPDGRDHTVADIPFSWVPNTDISGLRIGYLKAEFEEGTEARRTMYAAALDALRKAGARLEPMELPSFPARALLIILNAEAAASFDDLTRSGGVDQLSGQGPGDWPNTFRVARFIPAVEYLRAQRARRLLMRQMDELMAQWDVFVSPAPGSASLTITNLTGHPAVCVPCGFINGMPQAIMFTGRLYDEATLLRVALAFERATEWHKRHPKMDWA